MRSDGPINPFPDDPRVDIDKPALPQVAGYTTEAVLGEGGMATVYLAVQESLSRYVALKVMNQILTVDGDFCRRFLNEGRLVAKLSHPNIVTVYDIGVSDRFHYLSMTYLPGGTLREKINRGLLLGQALHIVKCLADALGYAHRQGIVHRDIKPGNVLFTDNGGPVLTDFGIAKTVGNETRLTSTGMTVGSVGYMSPEQTLGLEVDHRSDLYSLGVLFWQMLTGALPYAAPDPFALALKHAKDPIPELPRPLDRFQPVIERLMAKKPEDRLASAEELVRIVDRIPCDDIRSHSSSDCDATIVLPRTRKRPPRKPGMATGPDGALEAAARRRLRVLGATIGIAGLTGVAAYVGYMAFSAPAPEASVPPPPAASVPAPAAEAATVASTSVRAAGTPTQKSVGPAEAFPDAQIGPADGKLLPYPLPPPRGTSALPRSGAN
jgi:serine/threonine-protein kinase PpkA